MKNTFAYLLQAGKGQTMVRITADTSTLYSTAEARAAGFEVAPLSVTINGKSHREFDEIMPAEFVAQIREGHMPTSSQPAVGDVLTLFESHPDDEIINISMADGLSGTYQAALAAAQLAENSGSISVINSRTLCGPHRYLVENAVRLAAKGLTRAAIVRHTEELAHTAKSYLIPSDFSYLRRGGRLSPLVSYVGQAIHLVPVITPTEDGRQLTVAGVKRNFAGAVHTVAERLRAHGTGDGWHIYVSHADAETLARQAKRLLAEAFPATFIDILPLSPAFITQGGPGCIAIQAIRA